MVEKTNNIDDAEIKYKQAFKKNALNYGNMQRTQSIKKTLPY